MFLNDMNRTNLFDSFYKVVVQTISLYYKCTQFGVEV